MADRANERCDETSIRQDKEPRAEAGDVGNAGAAAGERKDPSPAATTR